LNFDIRVLNLFFFNIIKVVRANLELITWVVILILLMVSNPENHAFSLCPLDNLGFEYCPGCGLGRSCMHALNGNIVDSFINHPLGIFAIFIIFFRILTLTKTAIKHKTFKINRL
jgi:hypothetical protein